MFLGTKIHKFLNVLEVASFRGLKAKRKEGQCLGICLGFLFFHVCGYGEDLFVAMPMQLFHLEGPEGEQGVVAGDQPGLSQQSRALGIREYHGLLMFS